MQIQNYIFNYGKYLYYEMKKFIVVEAKTLTYKKKGILAGKNKLHLITL